MGTIGDGISRRPLVFDRCPWATVATEPDVWRWMNAFWLVKELSEWPPGRRDPLLYEVFSVIASEIAALDRDKLKEIQKSV